MRSKIRDATRADLPLIHEMAREYHALYAPAWPLNPAGFFEMLMDSNQGYLRIAGRGFLGGIITDHPLSQGWRVANELLWWADGQGLSLANDFRKWAKAQEARQIRWSCPPGAERVVRFMSRHGECDEVAFLEDLRCA